MARASIGQRLLLVGLLTVLLLVPPTLLVITGQAGLATAFVYGGIIVIGAMFYDYRLAVLLAGSAGIAGVGAVLLHPYPIAGGVFFGLLTGACALMARHGLQTPTLTLPLFISFVLVSPPDVPGPSTWTTALLTGVVIALGSIWTAAGARLILGGRSPGLERHAVGQRTALAYSLLMTAVLGVAAWAVLEYARDHQGAWLLLTLIVVLQPSPHDTVRLSVQRLAGTLCGGLFALAIVTIGVPPTVAFLMGGALLFAALAVRYALARPYWQYVTVLTPAIILLNASGTDGVAVVEDRVAFTAIAVIVSLGITLGIKVLIVRKAPREQSA
jgi:hypothetical protein